MSLITEVRTKADSAIRGRAETVVGTAKFAGTIVGNVLDGAANDLRERLAAERLSARTSVSDAAGTATSVAATLVGAARKQVLVTVGAGDVIVQALTKRAEAVPVEVQRNAEKGAATAAQLARSVRGQATTAATTVRVQGERAVGTARKAELPDLPAVRGAVDARVDAARDRATSTYDQLAARGDTVLRSARRSPRVLGAVTGADHIIEDAADELSSVAGKARYRAAANARSVRARKGAATRAARAETTTGGATARKPAPVTVTKASKPTSTKVRAAAGSAPTARKSTARKVTGRSTNTTAAAGKATASKTVTSTGPARKATTAKTAAAKPASAKRTSTKTTSGKSTSA